MHVFPAVVTLNVTVCAAVNMRDVYDRGHSKEPTSGNKTEK